jgi:hypothetical protein
MIQFIGSRSAAFFDGAALWIQTLESLEETKKQKL